MTKALPANHLCLSLRGGKDTGSLRYARDDAGKVIGMAGLPSRHCEAAQQSKQTSDVHPKTLDRHAALAMTTEEVSLAPRHCEAAVRPRQSSGFRNQRGFTLLEILVALSIFTVIGIGSWQILTQVLTTQQQVTQRDQALADLQRGMWIMARDIRNLAARPIRNEYHQVEPAVSTLETGYLFTFTRNGWQNPLNQPRSTLQRVAYQLDYAPSQSNQAQDRSSTHLLRQYWPVLDRTRTTEPSVQILIPNVSHAEVRFIDRKGIPRSYWPPSGVNDDEPSSHPLPLAVIVRLTTEQFGEIVRIFTLDELQESS